MTLPNLSSWHRVPEGVTLPPNTWHATVWHLDHDPDEILIRSYPHPVRVIKDTYTPTLILTPLPDTEGAEIVADIDPNRVRRILTLTFVGWCDDTGQVWPPDSIRSWSPVDTWHDRTGA